MSGRNTRNSTNPQTQEAKLRHVIVETARICTAAEYDDGSAPVKIALDRARVTTPTDLFSLSNDEIDSLTIDNAGAMLATMERSRLKILSQFYHYACAELREPRNIDPEHLSRDGFDEFRTMEYVNGSQILPWKRIIALREQTRSSDQLTPQERELEQWRKAVKPNASQIPQFKDELHWKKFRETMENVLESQQLPHLIDSSYTPTNRDLFAQQTKWLYAALDEKMKVPFGRKILLQNKNTKDTRVIWSQITEHFDNSPVADIKVLQISTYLTSITVNSGKWKGSQSNFILHYAEQARYYNEISSTPFNDPTLVMFLNRAVADASNLCEVLTNDKTSRRAAAQGTGRAPTPITFEEFLALLLEKAALYDAEKGLTLRRGGSKTAYRHVGVHDMDFFDGEDDASSPSIEVDIHDFETPIEDIIYDAFPARTSNNTGRRKAYMDSPTWRALSEDDRKAWDKISDSGKQSITTYAARNPEKYGLNPTRSNPNPTRQIQSHEGNGNPNPTIEASAHSIERQVHQIDSSVTLPPTTSSKDGTSCKQVSFGPVTTYDINTILSQPSKSKNSTTSPSIEAKVHDTNLSFPSRLPGALDIYLEDSDTEPEGPKIEVNSHFVRNLQEIIDAEDAAAAERSLVDGPDHLPPADPVSRVPPRALTYGNDDDSDLNRPYSTTSTSGHAIDAAQAFINANVVPGPTARTQPVGDAVARGSHPTRHPEAPTTLDPSHPDYNGFLQATEEELRNIREHSVEVLLTPPPTQPWYIQELEARLKAAEEATSEQNTTENTPDPTPGATTHRRSLQFDEALNVDDNYDAAAMSEHVEQLVKKGQGTEESKDDTTPSYKNALIDKEKLPPRLMDRIKQKTDGPGFHIVGPDAIYTGTPNTVTAATTPAQTVAQTSDSPAKPALLPKTVQDDLNGDYWQPVTSRRRHKKHIKQTKASTTTTTVTPGSGHKEANANPSTPSTTVATPSSYVTHLETPIHGPKGEYLGTKPAEPPTTEQRKEVAGKSDATTTPGSSTTTDTTPQIQPPESTDKSDFQAAGSL